MHPKFRSENLIERQLGRPRRRWKDNIRIDLRVGGSGLDTTHSGQGSVAGSCGHGNETSSSINSMEYLDYLSDYCLSKWTLMHGVRLVNKIIEQVSEFKYLG
jgi:hypothetical protein